MIDIRYNKTDKRYLFLTGDNKELKALEKHLNKIPEYMFLPSFNAAMRKPEVFLNKLRTNNGLIYYCHSGLWREVITFCEENNIVFNREVFDDTFKYTRFRCSLEEFTATVDSWDLNLKPRPYQIEAAWKILQYNASLSQLATRAGKTLIAYMVFRYALEHGAHNVLMIVPNINLVKQGVNDMGEYKEFFKTETVWAKGEYCACSNLTIGTFQSLVRMLDKKNKKYNPKFFDKFDIVLCDEVHTAKCKSIDTLLSQPFIRDAKIRFGFSGTLPDKNSIDSYKVQSLMGPMIQDISSKELMDAGFITPIDITQVRIHYKQDTHLLDQYIEYGEYLCSNYVTEVNEKGKRVRVKRAEQDFTMKDEKELPVVLREMKKQITCGVKTKNDYYSAIIELCKAQGSNLLNLEQMILHHSQDRIDKMIELLYGLDKNTIVFAHHTEYLKHLYNCFTAAFPGRNVYLITGQTSVKKREAIIEAMLHDKGAILVASYGCVGTGLTLKNIDYGIFAQSFKSKVIVLQSLGRGLCLADGKDHFYLYDIVDCLPTRRLEKQGVEHCKIYNKQKFVFRVTDTYIQ